MREIEMRTNLITKTVAGREIALPANHYIATRPMGLPKGQLYPVAIRIRGGEAKAPVMELEPMSYDEANEFLSAFNNGPMSFDGRDWTA